MKAKKELYATSVIREAQARSKMGVILWAKKAKLSVNVISKIRNGRNVTVANLIRGLKPLGLQVGDVFPRSKRLVEGDGDLGCPPVLGGGS